MGFSADRLRGAFEEGFIDQGVDPNDRHDARQVFFYWIDQLGFDPADFDWEEWREYFTDNTP